MTGRRDFVSLSVLQKAASAPASRSGSAFELTSATRPEPGARRRIWEIIGASHCSIIGTCLTLVELRKLARRTGFLANEARYGDYQIHGLFVEKMQEENVVSRAAQKHLDVKFEGAIRKAKALDGEDAFLGYWETAVDNGFVAGAYWALVGHPRLPVGVETRIFGDVHMMSHICGASHRGDAREIAEARREKADIARRLTGVVAERNDVIARQRADIARLTKAVYELEPLLDECERLRREAGEQRRETRRDELEREVETLRLENAALREDGERLGRRYERLKARRAPPTFEEGGEARLVARPAEQAEIVVVAAAEDSDQDLCGRCLLYVGGRPRTVCRLQQMVERQNGSLIHHDGGVEHSRAMLSDLVRRADAVFFPVDCVSHRAVGDVKTLCESLGIPYCPLRSASASAFEKAVKELGRGRSAALASQPDGV